MKKYLFLTSLFLFCATSQAQLPPKRERRGVISINQEVPISFIALDYTHYIGRHGVILGIFKGHRTPVIAFLPEASKYFPFGFEWGYKYQLRRIEHKWRPYAFYMGSIYHTKFSSFYHNITNENYTQTCQMFGLGMNQRLYQNLGFDFALGGGYVYESFQMGKKYVPSFSPYLKWGLSYQIWGDKDKNMLKAKMQRKYWRK